MYGYIITKDIAAENVDAWNRSVVNATTNFDAGSALILTAPTKAEDPWQAAAPAGTNLKDVWIAYPPSEYLAQVNDNVYAGLSIDPRSFTNIAGRPFDAFKVMKHDIIGFTKDCFDTTLQENTPTTSYFETKANQATWTVVSTPTADHTAFKIISNGTLPFPGGLNQVGMSQYQFVVGECVQD